MLYDIGLSPGHCFLLTHSLAGNSNGSQVPATHVECPEEGDWPEPGPTPTGPGSSGGNQQVEGLPLSLPFK